MKGPAGGLAFVLIGVGALLIWAGFQGVSLLEVTRSVLAGEGVPKADDSGSTGGKIGGTISDAGKDAGATAGTAAGAGKLQLDTTTGAIAGRTVEQLGKTR